MTEEEYAHCVRLQLESLRAALGAHPFALEVERAATDLQESRVLSEFDVKRLRQWFAGMGSLNDVWLEGGDVSNDTRSANERLDQERAALFTLLEKHA